MTRINFKIPFLISLFIFLPVQAQEIDIKKVDAVVEKTMEAFDVPGIAVGIIHKGNVVLAKGYGVTDIRKDEKVNSSTNFGVASNSKAFTATALVMLQAEGKLNLDDRVKKYIPEFKMYDDYVTENFTIRDLLVHRSGLGLGAGDLMVWPDGHDFTPDDVVKNIQYLKPVSDFRTKYDYDNLLYIIAGVVIERVSGKSWTDFIQENFLDPLEMNRTAPSWNTLKDRSNVISPHVPVDGELVVIDRYTNSIFDAAAGLYSNVDDMLKWVQFQLNHGKLPNGEYLIPNDEMKKIFQPNTIVPALTKPPYNTLFRAYGLGFFMQDINGKLEVTHTGGLEGIVTQVIMYPQLELGIVVLTNQQSGSAFSTISNTIKDFYLGLPEKDWLVEYKSAVNERIDNAEKMVKEVWHTVQENKKKRLAYIDSLTGTYKDDWFGEVTIAMDRGRLSFTSKRSPQLTGDMFYYRGDNFVVKWDNAYFNADAYVMVEVKDKVVTGFKMKPISPLTDFSYDFQDLDFKKMD